MALRAPPLADGRALPARAASSRPPRVLLLTSGLGWGHVRAANAIEAALRSRAPTAQVVSLDLWSLVNAGVAACAHRTYLALVQSRPDLYELLYGLDGHAWRGVLESEDARPSPVQDALTYIVELAGVIGLPEPNGGPHASDRWLLPWIAAVIAREPSTFGGGARARLTLARWVWRRLARRLETRLLRLAPDVVVSTQLIPAALLSDLKRRYGYRLPSLAVLTDFGVHPFWLQPGTDGYCVPHDSLVRALSDGRPGSRVHATGIPLMPGFSAPPSRAEARRQLEIDSRATVALVPGGGLGLQVDAIARRLLDETDLSLLVMLGRNDAARATLSELGARHGQRLRCVGWTERMELYMRAADLVVGKPGGITVAEALACGRPLFATGSLGGQEDNNVRFLARHGAGGLVPNLDLAPRLRALAANPTELHALQQRATALGERAGAAAIADLVLQTWEVTREPTAAAV